MNTGSVIISCGVYDSPTSINMPSISSTSSAQGSCEKKYVDNFLSQEKVEPRNNKTANRKAISTLDCKKTQSHPKIPKIEEHTQTKPQVRDVGSQEVASKPFDSVSAFSKHSKTEHDDSQGIHSTEKLKVIEILYQKQ